MFSLDSLHDYKVLSVDVETTGLRWHAGDRVFGVAVAGWDGKTVESGYWDVREQPRILEYLKRELPRVRVPVVNHSIKFDAHMLQNEGIILPIDRIECTMVRASLIDEHRHSHSLDACCKDYLGKEKVDIWAELAAIFGGAPTRATQIKNLSRAPASLARKYAAPDPALALELWLWQEKEIEKQGLQQVWGLEKSLTPVLIDIERNGVRVDVARAKDSLKTMKGIVDKSLSAMQKLVGKDFNANSAPQMRELFKPVRGEDENWRVGDVLLEKTDGGQPSMNKDALMELAKRGDKRAEAIVNVRKYQKSQQFLEGHILGFEHHGRVYPNYNQGKSDTGAGTGTGRFSINDPALQQMPKRDEDIAEIVRSCFLPEKGEEWLSMDYSQFEFRVFAHYTKDPSILKVYKDDPKADFHQVVSDLTGIPRKPRHAGDANSKQINLGLVFGMGQGKLAQEMGLPYTAHVKNNKEYLLPGPEAVAVFEKYHGAIPGVKVLLDKAASIARNRGYVKTVMGRHIRFPNGQFTHKAGGLVFQGTSADCMKQKMVEIWPLCKERGVRMLLSVHDELDFSVAKPSKRLTDDMVRVYTTFDGVSTPIKLDVPILCEADYGKNWYEACK